MLEILDAGQMTAVSSPASNAANTQANSIAQAINANQGIQNLGGGVIYNVFNIPATFTWTVYSNNVTGAAAVTVYGFNNDVLNALVTTNGGAANSIVNTFGDGFSGKIYQQFARSANSGQGVYIKGMTVQSTNYTSGAQTSAPFSTMALTVITTNGYGASQPISIDFNEALRNTQYNVGILTIVKGFFLNSLTQLQLTMPIDTQLVFTLFTQSSSFNG